MKDSSSWLLLVWFPQGNSTKWILKSLTTYFFTRKNTMKGITWKPAFYAVLFNRMKERAFELWYMLTIHGSLHRDMDLIAVAWTEDAKTIEELIEAIDECLWKTSFKESKWDTLQNRPHWRKSIAIWIMWDWYIDLSIIPPKWKTS